ncbi:MAG: NifU family protein [Prevotellaceae bacterium]|jgi:Fe-S cluster biogenesis protein NfuA|nr:NifU family protein [Prevotellaceae bacterium]
MKAKTSNLLESLTEKLEKVIEQEIRPTLRMHNGNIHLKNIDNGDIRLVFTGACKTCPSAQLTIEDVVIRILKEKFGDTVKNVYMVNETNEDMLSFAKKLLNKK